MLREVFSHEVDDLFLLQSGYFCECRDVLIEEDGELCRVTGVSRIKQGIIHPLVVFCQ